MSEVNDSNKIADTSRQAATGGAPKQIGPYQIIDKIGEGGMGIVYKAYQPQLQRMVAIKVVNHAGATERERKRLLREAQMIAKLKHPSIVCVHDTGSDDGFDYLVMEWIDGKTLDVVIQDGRLSTRKILEFMHDIAMVVDYAHSKGIIHRDLKPSNIMIERESGRPLVLDFGLAKQTGGGKVSMSAELVGTPRYIAPEMLSERSRKASPLVDVYALGAILYEMLSGGVPAVSGSSPMQIIHNVLHQKVASLHEHNPKINKDLDTICGKALEKDPRLRYASARALAEDIDHVLNGEPIAARRPGLVYRLRKFIYMHQGASAAITMLCMALVASLCWGWHMREMALIGQQSGKNKAIVKPVKDPPPQEKKPAPQAGIDDVKKEPAPPHDVKNGGNKTEPVPPVEPQKVEVGQQAEPRSQPAIPPDAQKLYLRGNYRQSQKDVLGAIADYTQAIQLCPHHTEAYNNRGVLRRWQGNIEGALADFNQALLLDPKHPSAYSNRANLFLQRGDTDLAIADCNKAIELDVNFAQAYSIRANALLVTRDIDKAIADLNKAIEINPQYPEAYYYRGNAFFMKGDIDRAMLDYSTLIRYFPHIAEAYKKRASCLQRQGKHQQAAQDLRTYLQLNPRDPEAIKMRMYIEKYGK